MTRNLAMLIGTLLKDPTVMAKKGKLRMLLLLQVEDQQYRVLVIGDEDKIERADKGDRVFVTGRLRLMETDRYDKKGLMAAIDPGCVERLSPVSAESAETSKVCECGASATLNPNLHSTWCPCF